METISDPEYELDPVIPLDEREAACVMWLVWSWLTVSFIKVHAKGKH